MNRAFFAGFGLLVWFLATVIFRLAGDVFFLYEDNLVMLGLYIVAAVGLIVVSLGVFRYQKLDRSQWFEAAAFMVVPGMILDAGVSHFFADIMVNMDAGADGAFAGWLLWAYAMPLVTAALPASLPFGAKDA